MKRRSFLILFFLCVSSFPVTLLAQENPDQSLLWRISGNGLQAPSYLFGTMHVKNKKAFYFKDSLYRFIEQAAGFAMELHPDSLNQIITAYAEGRLNFDDHDWDYRKKIDDKYLDTLIAKIKSNAAASKKSPKEKINYLAEKILDSKEENEDGMDTFMDAFLFGLARQNDKKIFGLEQAEDQIKAFSYLSNGIRFNKVSDLLNKWDGRTSSPVYQFYYQEKLDSIHLFYTTYFSDSSLKGFLYDRNIVMAHQMDSLMKQQTLFTAIGAGHLSGKEGVIALLRNKGYRVEPVYSSHKIFAGDYKTKPIPNNWVTGKSEALGFQYQMPGKITNQLSGNGKEVAYHFDLAGGMVFMIIAGRLSSFELKTSMDSIFDEQVGRILETVYGFVLTRKKVEIKGLKGYEVIANGGSNGFLRITELFDGRRYYVLTVTAQNKDRLKNEKAEQFLNSFTVLPLKEPVWTVMNSKKDGFAIEFPGTPGTVPVNYDKESNVAMNGYSVFDGNTGINYSVYVSKAKPGNSLLKGEYFFNSYINSLKENTGAEEIIQTDTIINGYPAKKFESVSFEEKGIKGLIVRRNNASYFISAEFEEAEKNNPGLNKFLRSFVLVPFPQTEWKRSVSPNGDFSSWVPGDIKPEERDDSYPASSAPATTFYAFDENEVMSYTIDVKQLSKYYWAPNEDSVYNYWKNKTVSAWSDSLLSYTSVTNGGVIGREIISINKYDKTKSRYRLLLNGRQMYVLGVEMDGAADGKNSNNFFEQFRINNEKKSNDIFTTTTEKLFNDLQSKDSTVFANAYASLDEVQFLPEHFHLVMEKALLEYPAYEDTYLTVNEKLMMEANKMAERSTGDAEWLVNFIRDNYLSPGKAVATHRFHLLGLLANRHTAASYQLIRELLEAKLPGGNVSYMLFNKLSDSLLLTKILYPDLLKYITDSSSGMAILSLTKTLIDSNFLDTSVIKPVQASMIKVANKKLPQLLKMGAGDPDYDYDYELPDLITLLGYLKQKSADDIVAEFLKTKVIAVKHIAAITLIRNGRPVSAAEIKKIAADIESRADFYEELKKLNKTGLFPAEFATQQNMGMSYIYNYLMYEDEMEDEFHLVYIKKIEQDYKGTKKRFFLFRVNIGSGEEYVGNNVPEDEESYLAIAGPFEMDSKKITLSEKENISGVYYDKKFDGLMNDEYFKKYITPFLKEDTK